MKLFLTIGLLSGASAFTTPRLELSRGATTPLVRSSTAEDVKVVVFDQEQFIAESKEMRLKHLEEQAMYALKIAVENYGNAVFPNAMIAGYVVVVALNDDAATNVKLTPYHLFIYRIIYGCIVRFLSRSAVTL